MIDINGSIQSMPRVPDVPVQFEGESSVEMVDFLENRSDKSETEGILAPQDLVSPGWALVIDLEHDELRYEPEDGALKRLGGPASSLKEVDYRRCEFDNHRITSVTINGVPTLLMIDTGAARTSLGRNNEAIPSMLSLKGKRGMITGVNSNGHQLLVSGVSIEFANNSFVLSTMVLPVWESCGTGVLGADLLSHCTMVWGSSSLWASCHAPPRE